MTGDIPDNIFWTKTFGGTINVTRYVLNLIRDAYKKCPQTRIFCTAGNHDSFPMNQYAPVNDPKIKYNKTDLTVAGTQPLYDFYATIWPTLAQDPSIATTVKKGAYFTTLLEKGVRLLSINNSPCYTYNFWLCAKPNLIEEQLIWAQEVLNTAEKNGEVVIVLLHIPGTESSLELSCEYNLNRLFQRYSHIIRHIANGHTHLCDIQLSYIGKCLSYYTINGGSVTPWNVGSLYENPNYLEILLSAKKYVSKFICQ